MGHPSGTNRIWFTAVCSDGRYHGRAPAGNMLFGASSKTLANTSLSQSGTVTGGSTLLFSQLFASTPLPSPWYDTTSFDLSSGRYRYQWTTGETEAPHGDAARIQHTAVDGIDFTFEFSTSSFTGRTHLIEIKDDLAAQYEGPSTGFAIYLDTVVKTSNSSHGVLSIYCRQRDNTWVHDFESEMQTSQSAINIYDGSVHTIRFRTLMNTLGSSDGTMDCWIDGVNILSKTNIQLRTISGQKYGQFMIAPYLSSSTPAPNTEALFIDNLYFYQYTGADTTAPSLNSQGVTVTGATTATLAVTTNEGNGTLYVSVTTSGTPPSASALKAGTGAAYSSNQSISSTGNKTFNATGLTTSTTYYAHFIHTDAASNDSSIVTTSSFVPTADSTAPTLSSPTATVTGSTTATVGVTTDEGNGTLYVVVTGSSTQPSVSQIKAGQTHTGATATYSSSQSVSSTGAKTFNAVGLTTGSPYYAHFVHTDAASNDSARSSTGSFTPAVDDYEDNRTGYLSGDIVLDSVNGNNANAGTLASPRATLQGSDITYALANNRRIWLRGHAGQQYTATTNYLDFYNKNGSSGSRMTIATYPGDTKAIWTNTSSSNRCQLQSSYWDFRNLDIRAHGESRDGFFMGENNPAQYVRFIDCVGSNVPLANDNSGCIHTKNGTDGRSDGLEVIRCSFTGSNPNGFTGGFAAIITFYQRNMKVIGCSFSGTIQGLYCKHDHAEATSATVDIQVKNCVFTTTSNEFGFNASFATLENCLIIDTGDVDGSGGSTDSGFIAGEESGNSGGRNMTINHCTFAGATVFLMGASGNRTDGNPAGAKNVTITNSIICNRPSRTGRTLKSNPDRSGISLSTSTNYNLYQNNLNINGTSTTVAARQPTNDSNSVSGTPVFVGSNTSTITDWALQSGSPGKGVGQSGTDIGCDVTKLLTLD